MHLTIWSLAAAALSSVGAALKQQVDSERRHIHEDHEDDPFRLRHPRHAKEDHEDDPFRLRRTRNDFLAPKRLAALRMMSTQGRSLLQVNNVVHTKRAQLISAHSTSDAADSQVGIDEPLTISFHLQGNLSRIDSILHNIALIFCVLLITGAVCLGLLWHYEDEPDASLCKSSSKESLPRAEASPRTHEDLVLAINGGDGTWVRNYQSATGIQMDALALLFRCGIIPRQEFANSRVSQEHIDECVWIASHMLRQRPLEEWVSLWPEAQHTFEQSVTACFTARTDRVRVGDSPPLTLHSTPEAPMPPGLTDKKPSEQIAQDLLLRSQDSSGENLLIMRCREIMKEARQQQGGRSPSTKGFAAYEEPAKASMTPGMPRTPPAENEAASVGWSSSRVKLQAHQTPVADSMPAATEKDVLVEVQGSSAACSTSTFRQVFQADAERARIEAVAARFKNDA